MTHLLHHPHSSTFACGAGAVGRRSTGTQCDPANTTCPRCLAWIDANPEWEAVTDSRPAEFCPRCKRIFTSHTHTCPEPGPRNMWGTPIGLVDAAEYCPQCERETPAHYATCPDHPGTNTGTALLMREVFE